MLFRRLDILDPASVDEFAAWAREHLGSVDILVNNAGCQSALTHAQHQPISTLWVRLAERQASQTVVLPEVYCKALMQGLDACCTTECI